MDLVGTPFVNFQVILQYVGRPALWPPWPCAAAESPAGKYGIRPYGVEGGIRQCPVWPHSP